MNFGEELRKALKPTVSTESDNTDSMSGTGSTDPALTPIVPELPGTGDATQQLPVVDENAQLIASLAPPALEDETPVTHDELLQHEVQDTIVHQTLMDEIDAVQSQVAANNQVQEIVAQVATMEGLVDADIVFHNVALESYSKRMGLAPVRLTLENGKISEASLEGVGTWLANAASKVKALVVNYKQNRELAALRRGKTLALLLQRTAYIRKMALKYDGSNTTPVRVDVNIAKYLLVKDGITTNPVKDLETLQGLQDVLFAVDDAFTAVTQALADGMEKATQVDDAVVTQIAKDTMKVLPKAPWAPLCKGPYIGAVNFAEKDYKPSMKYASWALPLLTFLEGGGVNVVSGGVSKWLDNTKTIARLDKATALQLADMIEKHAIAVDAMDKTKGTRMGPAVDAYEEVMDWFLELSNNKGSQPLAPELIPVFNAIVVGMYDCSVGRWESGQKVGDQILNTQAALLWWAEESLKV